MSTIWAFDNIENKHGLYCGKYFLKIFCSRLREYATNVISFEKKKILQLTKKELILHQDATVCCICGKNSYFTSKYRGAAHSVCNLRIKVPNEIPVVFHNGSNYDYHFITKELPNDLGEFECLGKHKIKVQNLFCSDRKRN